ncbi:MAG: guanylate kinase [Actinomycetota bacterium]
MTSTTPTLDDRVIVVISGPGGVGKGTIVAELLDRDPSLWLSRSWTTRNRRPGEAMEAYHFTDAERFLAHVRDGGFLEWVEFLDYYQGTPVPNPPPGHDVVFEIDVYGARQIAARYDNPLLLFVDAPSPEDQEARLRLRGDPEEKVVARLAKAAEERSVAEELGMVSVINDELERAITEVRRLIEERRAATPGC